MNKRFQVESLYEDIVDTEKNICYCDNQSICDLLNKMDYMIAILEEYGKANFEMLVDANKKVKELENQLDKFPPKIRELWLD